MIEREKLDLKDKKQEVFSGGNATILEVEGKRFPWIETSDFRTQDPWSVHMRQVLATIQAQGCLRGNFFEAGMGDGRNIIASGVHKNSEMITGIDLDFWRLNMARHNLENLGLSSERLDFHQGDVVGFLQGLPDGYKITGWGVACLPQAPGLEAPSHADGFDSKLASLDGVRNMVLHGQCVDRVGLTLNAAFLQSLRKRVQKNEFNLAIIFSDRIPSKIREELFKRTGWEIVQEYPTEKPVQQDPDTGVSYVEIFDDGKRFFEKTETGLYKHISAVLAEKRRVASENDGGRDSLNVYHHLSVYNLEPG